MNCRSEDLQRRRAALALRGRLWSETAQRVVDAGRPRTFRRSQTIFHEGDLGDTTHLLINGVVAVRRAVSYGELATIAVLGPGEWFGEAAIVSTTHRRTASAVAVDDVETLAFGRDELRRARTNGGELDGFFLELFAERIERMSDLVVEALFQPARKRIFRRLSELAAIYASGSEPTMIPLTQETIAELTSTTRSTVNAVLRAAVESGMIGLGRGRIVINDHAELERRAL